MAGLDATSQFFMFPAIREELAAGDTANASWILTIAGIVGAVVMLQAGRLADRFGHNRVLVGGAGVFGLSSALAAAAPNLELLIAARGLQAAGLAAIAVSSLAVIVRDVPSRRLATMLGYWGFWTSTSGVVGPILSSWLVEVMSWRVVFALEVPVAAAVVVLALPGWSADHAVKRSRIDYVGMALAVVGLALVVLAVLEGNDWGWLSVRTVASVLLGMAAIGGVLLRSRVHADPVIPLELFSNGAFTLSLVIGFIASVGFYGMWLALLSWLIDIWGWSVVQAGLLLTLMPGTMSLFSVRAGRIVDQRGFQAVMVTGAVIWTAGFTLAALTLGEEPSVWLLLPTLFSAGIGMATVLSPNNTAGTRALPEHLVGTGTAIIQTFARVGGAMGSALVVALLEAGERTDIDVHRNTIWLIAATGAAVAILSAALTSERTALPDRS